MQSSDSMGTENLAWGDLSDKIPAFEEMSPSYNKEDLSLIDKEIFKRYIEINGCHFSGGSWFKGGKFLFQESFLSMYSVTPYSFSAVAHALEKTSNQLLAEILQLWEEHINE